MSKFSIGDRVSFLYFGDKKKGTVIGHWPVDLRDTGTGLFRVTLDKSVGSQVCAAEKTMKKLKPKKPRREFWIPVETRYPDDSFRTFPTQEDAYDYIEDETDVIGWEVVHVKEVRG